MSLYGKNGSASMKDERNDVSDIIYSMTTPDQLSSSCATPEDESISGASTNEDCDGTPISLPMDESMPATIGLSGNTPENNSSNAAVSQQLSTKMRRSGGMGSGSNQNSPLPNGKKTKGRVKIKMEFIDNKLRRYTTFSKRKTGIMKKALELSTLTGTQVMLLVASETGHVYTFATKKLQPMITSETGKALIQTCLNTPDSPDRSTGADTTAMSANFHTSEIASLTPASLLFASNVTGNNSGSSGSHHQGHRHSSHGNSGRRSQKSHHIQQQHCANAVQDVLAAALQSHSGAISGKANSAETNASLNNNSVKGNAKASYYSANELPTMVPPSSAARFAANTSAPPFLPPSSDAGDEEDMDREDGDLSSLAMGMGVGVGKDNQQIGEVITGANKRRPGFQKGVLSPSATTSSSTSNGTASAGSTLNNILQNIVASRQQQRQQDAAGQQQNPSMGTTSQQTQQHQNRRKRHLATSSAQAGGNKQANLSGQVSSAISHTSNSNTCTQQQQLGSQLFPLAGLIPGSASVGGSTAAASTANGQQTAFSLFPALSNGAFLYPPGIVYTPTPVSLPEGAAAAFALQQMLASVMAATNSGEMGKSGAQQGQIMSSASSSGQRSSPPVQSSQQPMIPLPLPLSMMTTANYLAAQQSQMDMQNEEFDEGAQTQLDEDESE